MPSILLFGVTGLVGSHVVLALKKKYPNFPLTVYLRNATIDTYLRATVGVSRIEHGTYDEVERIASLAKDHDIVINVGSSWDTGLSEAIVDGLSKRDSGKKTILIHMSGTGNFVETRWNDGATHAESKIWHDDDSEDIKLINPKMLNGGPDTVVYEAGKSGTIETYVIYPPIIYGRAAGPVSALGIIQYFMHLKVKELGFIPYIGDGTAITNAVHVHAVVDFVMLVLTQSLGEDEPQKSVYERVYFIGGTETPWKNVSNWFAEAFFNLGISGEKKARSVTLEEAGEGEIPMLMSHDMRFTTRRAEKLGYGGNVESEQLREFLSHGSNIFTA
ncbi:hypothetical protein EJ08DRAFT_717078 [Tothia fuscella]|uniref:NAD(P)-binding domain-containing protein n=1 Tax=Tothia fuscella TaxID=1048955 RepID=A0A9P4NPH0_9PEZI|nr:hypothetical protein EJ08DRAFT_717078 [Tothia fuscella]